jgi:hypothetical protein
MIEFSQTIKDESGNEIKVGTKVRYWDHPSQEPGEVIEISDFDGDIDDDTGRSILFAPEIKVRYADGSVESYSTSEWWSEPGWNRSEGKCEELMVVKDG